MADKTNSTGITQWEKTFGGSAWDGCRAVRETKDGGYILVGDTQSFSAGAQDVWVIKTDPLVKSNGIKPMEDLAMIGDSQYSRLTIVAILSQVQRNLTAY